MKDMNEKHNEREREYISAYVVIVLHDVAVAQRRAEIKRRTKTAVTLYCQTKKKHAHTTTS